MKALIVGDSALKLQTELQTRPIEGLQTWARKTRHEPIEHLATVSDRWKDGAEHKHVARFLDRLRECEALIVTMPSAPEVYWWLGIGAALPSPMGVRLVIGLIEAQSLQYQPTFSASWFTHDFDTFREQLSNTVQRLNKARAEADADKAKVEADSVAAGKVVRPKTGAKSKESKK